MNSGRVGRWVALSSVLVFVGLSSPARADVIFDSFDSGGTFGTANTVAASGSTESVSRSAVRFTVAGGDYELDSVTVPVASEFLNGLLRIYLTTDSGGAPGTQLEVLSDGFTWPMDMTGFTTSTTLPSTAHPVLRGGARYWLVFELTALPSSFASYVVYHNVSGATVDYLEHIDGPPLMIADPWPTGPSAIVPTPIAFRIDGTPKAPNGDPCGTGAQCLSGNCVDSVCCDTACGGGVTDDCMACGVVAGGTTDGVCGPLDSLSAGGVVCHAATGSCERDSVCSDTSTACPDNFLPSATVCRPAPEACDVPETCTGTTPDCPADGVRPVGFMCNGSTGPCDPVEVCDGTSTMCPADVLSAAGTECAPVTGAPCDVADVCDGVTAACPEAFADSSVVCHASTGACDPAETCSGTEVTCPEDVLAPDGTACADGAVCNGDETCSAGSCAAGTALDCDDGDACTADMCAEPGGCGHTRIEGCCNLDSDCDDGDACTTDMCNASAHTCSTDRIAGCGVDAGTGAEDGGLSIDAGEVMMTADAGARDASVSAGGDGAIADAGTDVRTEGCGIAPGGAPRWPAAWFLVGAALCFWRRRR